MPAAGLIGRRSRSARGRRSVSSVNRPQPVTPIQITSVGASASQVTITFDQPVSCSGVPQYTVDVSNTHPVSASLVNPTTLQITYNAAVAAATLLTVPFEEPCVRNASGGFVATSTSTI